MRSFACRLEAAGVDLEAQADPGSLSKAAMSPEQPLGMYHTQVDHPTHVIPYHLYTHAFLYRGYSFPFTSHER